LVMSRQPRIPGEYLHIIVRGIGKQILFEDSSDYKRYLSSLIQTEQTALSFPSGRLKKLPVCPLTVLFCSTKKS
ncbi:MAG: hypothetical protein KBS46_08075, partial [Clostridiales bacterium]|nr:hypothetical protein [Candidatus Apopatocola equi]